MTSRKMIIRIVILLSLFDLIAINIFVYSSESETLSSTILCVEPASLSVLPGEEFIFDIRCIPGKPLKSFELKLEFDASVFHVDSVFLGDFFGDYSNYSCLGTIDNTNGYVTGVFGLILGPGNISEEGSLVSLSCSASDLVSSASSDITLFDFGVTDETSYVSVGSVDGLLTVYVADSTPMISNPVPSNHTSDVDVDISSVSVNINDPNGRLFNVSIYTNPSVGSINYYNRSNGTKSCSVSDLSYSTTYTWTVEVDSGDDRTTSIFYFTTEDEPEDDSGDNNNGGGTPSNGGGFIPPPVEIEVENDDEIINNAPWVVDEIFGPSYIELGVSYSFEVSTFDIDGDMIRFRFDWGDGTFSNWSNFVLSNESVSMVHSWDPDSLVDIRVIAEDEYGLSSNWSHVKRLTVSHFEEKREDSRLVEMNATFIARGNQNVSFNFSKLNISNGSVIISYLWDFGDGTSSSDINPSHVYSKHGEYLVTLTVVDSNGNIYTKTMNVVVTAESLEKIESVGNDYFTMIMLFGLILIPIVISLIILLFLFMKNRKSLLPFLFFHNKRW